MRVGTSFRGDVCDVLCECVSERSEAYSAVLERAHNEFLKSD